MSCILSGPGFVEVFPCAVTMQHFLVSSGYQLNEMILISPSKRALKHLRAVLFVWLNGPCLSVALFQVELCPQDPGIGVSQAFQIELFCKSKCSSKGSFGNNAMDEATDMVQYLAPAPPLAK